MNRIPDFTSKYFTVSRISGLSDMGRPIPFLSTNAHDYNLSDYSLFIDCYYGMGVGYRGNVNITRSGRPCQPWASQCPHRHWRFPEDVVDGQNDSNMCRNPDASAPDGPWCYTADPKVRWEYCNISRCPPRGLYVKYFLVSHSIRIHNRKTLAFPAWESLGVGLGMVFSKQ